MLKRCQFLSKICLILGILSVAVLAKAENDDNAIKMVTYFPVPYAAYNGLFVSQKMDVGTSNGSFTLNLGDPTCTNAGGNILPSLDTNASGEEGSAILTHVTNASTLSFNTDIYTPTVLFGIADTARANSLQFPNLRVRALASNASYPLQSLGGTNNVEVAGKLFMIKDAFTAANADASLPACEETITWQSLQLGNDNAEHYFLTCGEPESGCANRNAHTLNTLETRTVYSDDLWFRCEIKTIWTSFSPQEGCKWRGTQSKSCYHWAGYSNQPHARTIRYGYRESCFYTMDRQMMSDCPKVNEDPWFYSWPRECGTHDNSDNRMDEANLCVTVWNYKREERGDPLATNGWETNPTANLNGPSLDNCNEQTAGTLAMSGCEVNLVSVKFTNPDGTVLEATPGTAGTECWDPELYLIPIRTYLCAKEDEYTNQSVEEGL